MAISSKAILKKIGNANLNLVYATGDMYWYFIYDNVASNVFETETILVPRLNDMEFNRWVEYGKDFSEKVEKELAERKQID